MPPALSFDAVCKTYTDRPAVDKVTFVVDGGELVALVGHNGSGKSTLLSIAAGTLEATSGTVVVTGATAGSIEARRALAYVPDSPVLYDDLGLIEQIGYVARMHDVDDWEPAAESLMARFRLADRSADLPGTFSRGMRQKAAIAMAFVRPFAVLALDEPFVGLDEDGRDELLQLVDAAVARGAAVIIATHSPEFAERATRNIVLRDGRVIHDGAPTADNITRLVDG